jgi:protein O-GlcNAc transferase
MDSIIKLKEILSNKPFNKESYEQINYIYEVLAYEYVNQPDIRIKILEDSLTVCPENPMIHFHLGNYYELIDMNRSVYHYRLTIALNSNNKKLYINTYVNISNILIRLEQRNLAKYYILKAILLDKYDPDVNSILASIYTDEKNFKLANNHFKLAIENYSNTFISDNPNKLLSDIYNNYSFMFNLQYNYKMSVKYQLLSFDTYPTIMSLYCKLMNLNYHEFEDKMYNTNQHKLINNFVKRDRHYIFNSDYFNTERINIGFVSGDFDKGHPVEMFLNTFLTLHDSNIFNITCYSEKTIKGNIYKIIKNLTSGQTSDLIHNDKIHILIDLSGHTTCNRLDVFANKPAPIQISWIGYPFTTGLNEIDYRITDSICDNENSQQYYTEKLLFLDNCFLCYQPIGISEIKYKNDNLVIGCFNRHNKITDKYIELCNLILTTYSNIEFKFNTKAFNDQEIANEFRSKFIDPNRISFIISPSGISNHLDTYNQVDITLDTFPYSGTTTSCESLLMGVPVLTIYNPDNFHVSNVTTSILKNSNLNEYVCNSFDDIINKLNNIKIDKNEIRSKFMNGYVCNKTEHIKNITALFNDLFNKHKI